MNSALIGYTGFIGSNLKKNFDFNFFINRTNLSELSHKTFDIVVCAGLPATKWFANQNPHEDLSNSIKLIDALSTISTKKFILISTVDVYQNPWNCNEDCTKFTDTPYGKNRYLLERFIASNFENHSILRLPGLFGEGLKKNVIFDLINQNQINKINPSNVYQWYPINELHAHIKILLKHDDIKVVNLCSEPISVSELAKYCNLNINFHKEFEGNISYDVRSKYTNVLNSEHLYMYKKDHILNLINTFIRSFDKA